jgi:hypothetical protein
MITLRMLRLPELIIIFVIALLLFGPRILTASDPNSRRLLVALGLFCFALTIWLMQVLS